MKPALWVFAAVALLAVVYAVVVGRSQDRWHRQVDSLVVVSAVKDSLAQAAMKAGLRYAGEAGRLAGVSDSLNREAHRLQGLLRHPVLKPNPTPADSLRYWRDSAQSAQGTADVALQALDLTRGSLDSLKSAFTSQQAATASLTLGYNEQRDRADAAIALLRKAPRCHRLLGIPIPKFGVGAALTTRGLEPALAIVIPLGGC